MAHRGAPSPSDAVVPMSQGRLAWQPVEPFSERAGCQACEQVAQLSQLHDTELSLPLDVHCHCLEPDSGHRVLGRGTAVAALAPEFSAGAEVRLSL